MGSSRSRSEPPFPSSSSTYSSSTFSPSEHPSLRGPRMTHRLTAETANRFAEIALGHVTKEFPHKLDHVLEGPEDALPPRELHPIFFGSFDWHSCVHGYWLLLRLRRLF